MKNCRAASSVSAHAATLVSVSHADCLRVAARHGAFQLSKRRYAERGCVWTGDGDKALIHRESKSRATKPF
jgi:hypothetical protein